MSKKDRLKKQSLKQLEAKKDAAREEQRERSQVRESKSARKLRRRAKKLDSALTVLLKIFMCVPFLWSGLYYGGIFIVGISGEQMDDVPVRIAVFLGIGSALCLTGIVLAFLSKYIVQFLFCFAGAVTFMQGASYIVDKAKERIGEGYGLTEEQKGLAAKWRWGLYPIMAVAVISAVLLARYIIKKVSARRRRQRELDNAPVKSIVD
ncbi:MAG: YqkE family protein [Ruminococcus sp.]|nr:YqkE family protein [Ruminococcus sp.]